MKPNFARIVTSVTLVVALPASSLVLTGCAPTADGQLAQQQGTAMGAIAGGALGYALGGQRGAMMGALIGGAAGFAVGTNVAQRKAKYARAEQWLNEEIRIARQANNKARVYNRSLQNQLAALEQKARVLRASGNKAGLQSLKAEISQVANSARQFNSQQAQTATDVKQVMADSQARAATNFSSFQKEANDFKSGTAETGRLIGRLASLQNSIDR